MEFIDCEKISKEIKERIKEDISNCKTTQSLAVIQVGNDIASNSYIKGKERDCNDVGIKCLHIKYNDDITEEELTDKIIELNLDPNIDGIIVQLPLPKHMNETKITKSISVDKDVDGFRSDSIFTPCTPKGIITIFDYIKYGLKGKHAVIAGRSNIVGKPLAKLLVDKDCTVTICNSHTSPETLDNLLKSANVFVSAIGKAKHFDIEKLRNVDVVIDVGINRDKNGKLCGDINTDCVNDMGSSNTMIAPVPKGVGLMTRVSLLENVLMAHKFKE